MRRARSLHNAAGMTAQETLTPRRPSLFRSTFAATARQIYEDHIRVGSVDEHSRGTGEGIPLDVLQTMRGRAPGGAAWSDVTEYYAMPVGGQLTYASITRGRWGESIDVFNALGGLLARGSYPVDDDGKACGDVLWR
jgi:hypothetical protein